MPIWLNYWYSHTNTSRLLKNYIYLINGEEDFSVQKNIDHITDHIHDNTLLRMLQWVEFLPEFDQVEIQNIMLEAYPYEVLMKFKWEDIMNDKKRNERLIWNFDRFFKIDYHTELNKYCIECNRWALQSTYLAHEKWRYSNIAWATKQFFAFIHKILNDQWYMIEAEALQKYMEWNLKISHQSGISGNTDYNEDKIEVDVWNNTYTTLFHELIHATNRFFRTHYSDEDHYFCEDNLTKTNEWLANFVAYHLMDTIIAGDVDMIDNMTLEPIFFSMYIDIYATMREHGTNDRKKNYEIIHQELKKFEWDLLTDEKARFYYERFYKFFHYDQHEYFYPKEMMYYLGYNGILDLFRNSDNKKQLLASCLLGKVCL